MTSSLGINVSDNRYAVKGLFYCYSIPHGLLQVSFQCERGYILEGSEWATCLQSGQWSADTPRCEMIQCPPPPTPNHGRVLSQQGKFF